MKAKPLQKIPRALLTMLAITFTFCGCEGPPTPPEEIKPSFQEETITDNLTRITFGPLPVDKTNAYAANYAKALREWTNQHPEKRIISILGVPIPSGYGLASLWIRTTAQTTGEPQQILQVDHLSELPEKYSIPTFIFNRDEPAGVLAITP